MTHSIQAGQSHCERCECFVSAAKVSENEFGEFICEDCEQNANEAAWERVCEAFHDGGATSFLSIRDQQEAARRLK
jgi:hypothetical protein